ncbi:MAG TPA: hypothetical protein VMR70_20570 [Flavisolibacter sp.]|nr:hypothetical protein [Flavisolibacter sp.]
MRIDTNEETVFITSGPGLENCEVEKGNIEVKYAKGSKQFESIIPAVKFYFGLNEEASLWDMTGEPQLIESKFAIEWKPR